MTASPLFDLVGRHRECAVLDELLVGLRAGESRVRVFRGEAGIGKSVLLEFAVAQASQVTVTRAQGVEADMELPYASEHLRAAYEMFDGMRANAFAERTRRELIATGEHVRARVTKLTGALTPQESKIATLAADGMTNAKIGAELFISPHTVEWHLRKVYTKLGINSRRALPDALTGTPARDTRERGDGATRQHRHGRSSRSPQASRPR